MTRFISFIVKLMILIHLVQSELTLKQVVILNRHSLRAPLSKTLKDISPKAWPEWGNKPGFLTANGARLAGYMGSYFAAWLKKERVLSAYCPSESDLYVFANTVERTLTSAQSFVEKGFPDCKVNVHYTDMNKSNSLFNPIIHNTSATFIASALEEINEVLNIVHLNEAYELLNNILDYKHSRYCEIDKKCNLIKDKNVISLMQGLKPQLLGPLKIGFDVVDAFLMQNYEGFPTENIAWGQLIESTSWKTLIQFNRDYINVTYNTRLVARDISGPLIKYLTEIFLKNNDTPKVTLLFGHDVNIHTVFRTLLVKPYSLEKQIEIIPIGSAAVFQKWWDDEHQKTYFKLSFVYQSMEQLRNCNILTLNSPPQIKNLELEKCKVDKDGFCSWDDFITLLESL